MNELLRRPTKLNRLTLYQKNKVKIDSDFNLACQLLIIEEYKKLYSIEEILSYCETIYRKCKQFELTVNVVQLSIQIARFIEFNGDELQRRKINKYISESKVWKTYFDLEFNLKQFTYRLNRLLVRKMAFKNKVEEIEVFLKGVKLEDVKTYNAQLNYYEIVLKKNILSSNKEQVLRTCQKAIDIFDKKRFKVSSTAYAVFLIPQIPLLIEAGKYKDAKDLIDQSYLFTPKKGNNWFAVHSYEVISNFLLMDFETTGDLLKSVKNYPNAIIKERYELYNAYYSLIENSSFKINKFLNSTIQFSRDKRGYNISVIIVKLLHLLKQEKNGEFIDLIENTNQYIKLWINQKEVLRSKIFLKMLLTIPKSRFRKMSFELNTKRYRSELSKTNSKEYSVEVELVEYEYLYEFVLTLLK